MNKHFESMLFVCQSNDTEAVGQLNILRTNGHKTQVLLEAEYAPQGSVALYTGHNEMWPSRWYRVAAHRLYETRPAWAITTPFLVSLRPKAQDRNGNLGRATLEMAKMYERWLKGDAGVMLPWETRNGPRSTYIDLVEGWLDMVATTIGSEELQKILEAQVDHEKHKGRGGFVVHHQMSEYGRKVMDREDLPTNLPGNSAYCALTGFCEPVVSYGTSDLANVFELLQAIKLGHHLGLPTVFETYPNAHNLAYWLNGFLNPSLKILGSKLWTADFGLTGESKYTENLDRQQLRRIIDSGKLENIEDLLDIWGGKPLWQVYQLAMRSVADQMLAALGIEQPYALTTTEDILKATGLWHIPAQELAHKVDRAAGHSVVIFNQDQGTQIMTGQRLPDRSVAELHEAGWWLGGAALYYMVFNMGNFGGVVVMAKDSTAGRVNLLARNFFGAESQLYISPVGLFRLSADEQNEDWSIDPLVMLSLMREWGPETTAVAARTIWDAMEVPLEAKNIGNKTVAKVTRKGVVVRTQSA